MMNRKICIGLVLSLVVFCIVFSAIRMTDVEEVEKRYQQHEVAMEEGADPSLGITEFEQDEYTVDETFETHLPLVIIDLEGNEIPDAYYYDSEQERFVLADGVDPYVDAKIEIIDNDDYVNTLSDTPDIVSNMQIKYRGNSSVVYDKHQFKIKLLDEDGNKNEQNIMGMGEEADWILNISMIDESLVRNYMVYNICGEFMEYTPDVRYCEVIMKDGDTYTYQGLYLMMESVKQGEDRVAITEHKSKDNYTSYLLRRDRYDEEDIMLDTYATKNELCYGYLALRYPSGDDVTNEIIDYVTEDISQIEEVLFSEDEEVFMTYSTYIDEDSFVDYFLLNEFFTNYDAGNNSTYLYKEAGGKLKIGPVWDYDNAMDNIGGYLLDPTCISFEGQAWFEQLLQSEEFTKKLVSRYQQLQETYFSEEYINDYIDNVVEFLGNAQKRDWSRWQEQYTKGRFELIEDSDGVVIDRNYTEYEDVVQRVKDVLNEHSQYILPELKKLQAQSRYKDAYRIHVEYAILFIVVFLTLVVTIRRKAAR